MPFRMNKALFLDLDGTIVRPKNAREFPNAPNDYEYIPGILPKIKKYSDEGYVICIVTNQAGITAGHITYEFIEERLNLISQEIEQYIGASINYAYCPHFDNYDRKPFPGMAYLMANKLDLDLGSSIMVGDSGDDRGFARNARIGEFIYVGDFTGNYTYN